MSDLFNKLAMRRKGEAAFFCHVRCKTVFSGVWICRPQVMCPVPPAGISGKGPAGGESGEGPAGTGGAFARMSDVIPPLPAPHSTTDDDDWEA